MAYLKGLISVGEVVPAAKQYRDRLLVRVVVGALQVGGRWRWVLCRWAASPCLYITLHYKNITSTEPTGLMGRTLVPGRGGSI